MPSTPRPEPRPESLRESITSLLDRGTLAHARQALDALHPAELGRLLESLPSAYRALVWPMVPPERRGDVLLHVNDEVRDTLMQDMETREVLRAAEGMDTDDLADFVQDLPETLAGAVRESLDRQDRHRLETVLSYPEDTAGGLMDTNLVTVRPDVTLDMVLGYLRLRGELPDLTDNLIVVDRDDRYLGLLGLAELVVNDPGLTVEQVYQRRHEPIPADQPARDVARRFEDYDLVSAPVVDADGRLLGRITVDDVVDVIREEADRSMLHMAGLGEDEDMFAPVLVSARRRAVWLGANLGTAFLAAWVIGRFEATLDQIVALAVLMPVVASMGGIAGTQTLTVMIRGLALGQVDRANSGFLLGKELGVGALNGLLWALVVGLVAYLWFGSQAIGLIIAAAMVINLLCAALTGVLVPVALRRLDIDPALAGGVVLTTVTDVVGFLAFLGLATAFLLD